MIQVAGYGLRITGLYQLQVKNLNTIIMKHILLIFLMAFVANWSIKAQSVTFHYDDAGNRTERIITLDPLPPATAQTDTSNIVNPEEFEKKLEMEFGFQKLAEGNIKVYPNPTEGALMVCLENFETLEGIVMQLFNSSGSLIESKEVTSDFSEFNMHTFSPGIYILRLSRGQEKLEYKIIKR